MADHRRVLLRYHGQLHRHNVCRSPLLSPAEVARHAQATGPLALSSEPTLAGYWSFDGIPKPPPAAKVLRPQVGPEASYRQRLSLEPQQAGCSNVRTEEGIMWWSKGT
jgi:hypothetical protein